MNPTFESLGLAAPLLAAVADEGYTTPTPIQVQAIPHILARRDVLAAAQTGTGKTAGFTLPLLQLLSSPVQRPVPRAMRALILTPTRELAAQVEESVRTYGRHLHLKSTIIFGGVNINPQIAALASGQDIVVATPGRLLDHVGQRTIDLGKVEVLVLDEADRMLDMGFIHDIRRILKLLPPRRQNLLFSATFSDEIRALVNGLLHDYVTVEVARRNETAALVTHVVHDVARDAKRDALRDLIVGGDWRQVLVFTRMKHGANRLAEQLSKDGLESVAIHGNKSQNARTRALAGFKDGSVRVLVATDIAARGLDIEQLPHVVNYELPNVPEDYVHRIGRTGRAGSPGHAVSLVSPDEHTFLRDIERLLKRALPRVPLPPFDGPRPVRAPEAEPAPRAPRPGGHRAAAGARPARAARAAPARPAAGRNSPAPARETSAGGSRRGSTVQSGTAAAGSAARGRDGRAAPASGPAAPRGATHRTSRRPDEAATPSRGAASRDRRPQRDAADGGDARIRSNLPPGFLPSTSAPRRPR